MIADEEAGKLLLSEPKQIISLIGDDAPQYVESESEINEESVNKKIVEKILEDWKGKIKPCRVDLENLTPANIEKLKKRLLQKEPVCIPCIPLIPPSKYHMSEVEVISETDLEMFPEDTSSVITDNSPTHSGQVRNRHSKPADVVETSTEIKKEKSDVDTSLSSNSQQVCSDNKENVFEESGSSTVKEAESAFNTSTDIETRNSIPSCMNTSTEIYTADETPELQKQSTSNPVTLQENVKHQTHENFDNDDFVDASQSLFDDRILDSDDVQKEHKITSVDEDVIEDTKGGSESSEKNKEKLSHDLKSEDSTSAMKADVGENECKTVQEAKQEESDDEDEVLSLRPDSDSEPEVDVTNVWNSGEDEACVIDGAFMGNEDTRHQTENSEATNNRGSPSKADDGKPASLSHQSTDVGFVPEDEKGNDLLELKSSAFDEAPDSPVMDLLPDKSDSEPDEDEWIHTSKIESAVDESDMSAFDPPTEDTIECNDEKAVQKSAQDEDVKKDEPEVPEHRRSLRSVNRLSLSAKKKKKSGEEKSVSATKSEPSKRQTRSSPITVKQEDVKYKRNTMSSNITDAGKGTKDSKSKATLRSKENKSDDAEIKEEKLETFKRIKKENDDDHFESPLSQKSNGFTIETGLICDDEVNIIEECANEDDSIALSQMPILIESSDDEELAVKPESEPFFSDDEYHSLFVISSDDEYATAKVKEKRERHTSGYGSDLEIIGEETDKLVKVKEENEDKIDEKVEDDAVKQGASDIHSSVSDGSVTKDSSESVQGKSTQTILPQVGDESNAISNRKESHKPQSPQSVDLVAVADEEVRKFLTGGMLGEIESGKTTAERRSKVAEAQTFSDSSDDESFEDLEGDFLEKKELEKKKLAEAEKNRAMLEKETAQSSDSSDFEDEDLEGDFLSRIEKQMKSKREMSSSQEKDVSGNVRNEKDTLTSVHKDGDEKEEAEGHKEISVSATAIGMGSEDAESECQDDKEPSGENPSDVSDDESENGEVTFKPGTPKMDDFEEFAKESSPEETLPDIPAPEDTTEEEQFISIPSSSFYRKEKTHKLSPPSAQVYGTHPGKIVKKPVGLVTVEDMRLRTQRLRGGKGRLIKTPFEVQSNQIARAKAQMKERMKNKSKGSNWS